MEREVKKGSCPLMFERIEFGNNPFQTITSEEKLDEVLAWLLRVKSFRQYAEKTIINNVYMDLDMVALMLPFFFLAMYEKDGFPAEKILYFMVRQKILTPGIRPYKSENLYKKLEEREKIKREVCYLEEKAAGRKK